MRPGAEACEPRVNLLLKQILGVFTRLVRVCELLAHCREVHRFHSIPALRPAKPQTIAELDGDRKA
jgi:hypothetical protein